MACFHVTVFNKRKFSNRIQLLVYRSRNAVFTKSVRSRDFLLFPMRVASKINRWSRVILSHDYSKINKFDRTEVRKAMLISCDVEWLQKSSQEGLCVSINTCFRPYFSLVPLFSALPGALYLQNYGSSQQFFSLVCLHWFAQFLYVTQWNLGSRLKCHIVAIGVKNGQH